MIAEKEYLIEILKKSGIKSQIYTSMKKLKASNETHVAAVLFDGESFERSNSKRRYIDKAGIEKRRKKIFERETRMKVIISDNSEEKVEEITMNFLRMIGTGFPYDGNWIDIWIEGAEWLSEGDHILRGKIAVELKLTLKNGVYSEETLKSIGIGEIG